MRPIGHVMPAALMELLSHAPLSDGKVTFAWKAAVGPALERATAVKLESGVLFVDATGPQWAREIRRSNGVILTRLKTLLGEGTVQRIEVRIR
jgi:predicted nucleic acid-binding Zn ribbon protein